MNNKNQNGKDEKNMKSKQYVVMVNNGINNEIIITADRETEAIRLSICQEYLQQKSPGMWDC